MHSAAPGTNDRIGCGWYTVAGALRVTVAAMASDTLQSSWRIKLAFGAFGMFAAFALGECGLRGYERFEHSHRGADDDAWRDRVRRMNRTIYRRSDDPRLIYEPNPSTSVPMPYGPAGFNAGAMRDDHEIAIATDPTRPRVAILGDSLVWSEEVPVEDSLPRRIGDSLASTRAEVLNFGVTGYDTAQEAAWFEDHVRTYHPDVVVVVYCLNDVMIMSGPFNRFATPEESARKDAQDALLDRLAPLRAETLDDLAARDEAASASHLLSRAQWTLRRAFYDRSRDYQDEYSVLYAQPDSRRHLQEALQELSSAIHRSGARAHLVISPVLRDFSHYHWDAIHAWIAGEARRVGFTVSDPLGGWRGHERGEHLRLPGDSLHYNPTGQRVLAAFIADAIRADVQNVLASRTTH